MMGDDTNVCKMLRLWGVISMLALDLLLFKFRKCINVKALFSAVLTNFR